MAASGVEVGTHTPPPGRSSCCWGSPEKPELGLEQTNVEKVPNWEPVLPAGPRVPGSAHPAFRDERACRGARCVCSSHSWCGSWPQCPVQTGRSSELAHGGLEEQREAWGFVLVHAGLVGSFKNTPFTQVDSTSGVVGAGGRRWGDRMVLVVTEVFSIPAEVVDARTCTGDTVV